MIDSCHHRKDASLGAPLLAVVNVVFVDVRRVGLVDF